MTAFGQPKTYSYFCRNEPEGCPRTTCTKGGQCRLCADRSRTLKLWGRPKISPPVCRNHCGRRVTKQGNSCRYCWNYILRANRQAQWGAQV